MVVKKEKITIEVSGEKTRQIDAYRSLTPGLFVHRQLVWVPASGEHKFTSKWAITHEPTGRALLHPTLALSTMDAALALCNRLNRFDWTSKEPPQSGYQAVKEEYNLALSAEEVEDAMSVPSRYVIRKVEGGYGVIDTVTDALMEKFVHRGLASAAARDMNEKESV